MNNPAPVSAENAVSGEEHQPRGPYLQILKGHPTDAELAALIVALSSLGGHPEPGQTEQTRWGLPVDRLRFAITNHQRVTLQERIHMQR